MQTDLTVSRAAHTGQSEEVAASVGDTIAELRTAWHTERLQRLRAETRTQLAEERAQATRWVCASCGAEFPHVPGDADVRRCTKCVEVEVLCQRIDSLLAELAAARAIVESVRPVRAWLPRLIALYAAYDAAVEARTQ